MSKQAGVRGSRGVSTACGGIESGLLMVKVGGIDSGLLLVEGHGGRRQTRAQRQSTALRQPGLQLSTHVGYRARVVRGQRVRGLSTVSTVA